MEKLVTITAVGDIMLGDHPVRIGNGVRSRIEQNGADWLFSEVRDLLGGSDIVFGNLEVVHSDIGLTKNNLASMEFRGSPQSIPALRTAGFNVLNFANNHCLEHGVATYQDTVRRLEENNVSAVGLRGMDGRTIPYEISKEGARIVVLAYSLRPEEYCRSGEIPYALSSETHILQDVAHARQRAEVVVVSLHWGEEFMDHPSPQQISFAHRLVDAGAKLILGHHPHVLQGIESYQGAVIAYSLGNFVFDMWQKKTRATMALKATIGPGGDVSYEAFPIHIDGDFRPIPLQGHEREKALRNFDMLSRAINSEVREGNVEQRGNENIEHAENVYLREARRQVLNHRLGNYLYFAVNIYRYSPVLILESLKRSVARRLGELRSVLVGTRGSH